jgi:hypothetical protein
VPRLRLERFADVVGSHDDRTPRPEVDVGRPERLSEVDLGRHVHHRVVDEDRVEGPSQANRAHVAEHVLAVGVQRLAEVEHRGRDVGEGEAQVRAQVRGGVAAA